MEPSLERWRRAANGLFAVGREPYSLALLASFSGHMGRAKGGAIISLVGDGRLAALNAAASVWDDPPMIDVDHNVLSTDRVLFAPELGARDPLIVKSFVEQVTDSNALLIAASSTSVIELMPDLESKSRVLEFTIPNLERRHRVGRHTFSPSEELAEFLREFQINRGHAGSAFAAYLRHQATKNWISEVLPEWTEELWYGAGARQEIRRWSVTMGLIVTAGVIVSKLGLASFFPARISQLAGEYLANYDSPVAIQGRIVEAGNVLQAFILDHVRDCMIVRRKYIAPRFGTTTVDNILQRELKSLHMRYERDNKRLMIARRVFDDHLDKLQMNIQSTRKQLVAALYVTNDNLAATLGAGLGHNLKSRGQVTCLEVNMFHPGLAEARERLDEMAALAEQKKRNSA